MKKLFPLLFFALLLGFAGNAQVKIGLPAGPPQASSLLDLSNTGDGTRAFTLPRVATTASILLPVSGMLIYDISAGCIKAYESGAWTGCLSQPTSTTPAVGVSCGTSVINGIYTQSIALTASNTVTIVVENNSFSAVTISLSPSDILLGGAASTGMSVLSVAPASVSPGIGGGTSTITYTLSGTPIAAGSFTATWSKVSLTCTKTGAVCLPISPVTITNTTTPSTLPSTIGAGNTIDFTAGGGLNKTGISWVMSSTPAAGIFSSPTTGTGNTAQAVLVAGASGVVTVLFTATNACGLLVTQTQSVSAGALYVNCSTSAVNGIYTQGTALTTPNTITMVVANYALTAKTVTAATSNIVLSGTAAAGITVASVLPASASIPANGTATFTYTLSGTPTAVGSFTATYTNVTLACIKTGLVCLPISSVIVTNTTTPSPLVLPIIAGSTVDFTAAGGTNNTGITWAMTSSPASGVFTNPATGTGNTAQSVLAAGSAGTITVVFTATNACGLLVTGTQTASISDLQFNGSNTGISGFYTQNVALNASNIFSVYIRNNGTTAKTFTPAIGDVVLSGTAAAGMSVNAVSAASSIAPNTFNAYNYTLTGTPTTLGNFIATFTNGTLKFIDTSTDCVAITPFVVSNTTNPATLPAIIVTGNTINFTTTGGTPNTSGISWTMTSSPATGVFSGPTSGTGTTALATLVPGTNGTVTITYQSSSACTTIYGTQTVSTGDGLRAALAAASCTSCTAYDAASADTWVSITAGEYAQLDNFMPVNKAACADTLMNLNANGAVSINSFLTSGANAPTLPASNYVVAFSLKTYSGTAVATSSLKYSVLQTTGYSTGGANFAIPANAGNVRLYYIMKKPSAVINSVPVYVGIYSSLGYLSIARTPGTTSFYGSGDATVINNSYNLIPMYQVKGTDTRRW